MQVIPVNTPTVAIYENIDGKLYETDIFYLALTADGYLRPIEESEKDFEFCDTANNFICIQHKNVNGWREHIGE